jgi:hypothetical protein
MCSSARPSTQVHARFTNQLFSTLARGDETPVYGATGAGSALSTGAAKLAPFELLQRAHTYARRGLGARSI